MACFDVSKAWLILSSPVARAQANELARCIALLRGRVSLEQKKPGIENAETFSPSDSVPIILLSDMERRQDHGGFTWRAGEDRIEIYGDSRRGLWNGVFDFLFALGFRWPAPSAEELPLPVETSVDGTVSASAQFVLRDKHACVSSNPVSERRSRLILGKKLKKTYREKPIIEWAARNGYDALVVPFRFAKGKLAKLAAYYGIAIEPGGWEISRLVPRRLFSFHKEMFRMVFGKRSVKHHFCPTNPATIETIKKRALRLFLRTSKSEGTAGKNAAHIAPPVFHLWPDNGYEEAWCSCPACRAFTPSEQNLIAVNSAAGVLMELFPNARLSYLDLSENAPDAKADTDEAAVTSAGILHRENTFAIDRKLLENGSVFYRGNAY